MIRVVLVEDQPLVRGGIAMLLGAAADIEVVGEAGDGLQALQVIDAVSPDVVLMDLQLPGRGGVELTSALLADRDGASATTASVLVLTAFGDDESVYSALRAGASGFLFKESAPAHLVDAVRSVAAGDAWLDPSVAARVLRALQQVPHQQAWSPGLLTTLTARERETLALIALGLSNAEIAARFVVSEATVKTHVHRILMKTGCRDRAQAVVLAYRTGLVTPS